MLPVLFGNPCMIFAYHSPAFQWGSWGLARFMSGLPANVAINYAKTLS